MSNNSPRDYSFIAPMYDHVFNKPLSEGHRTIGSLLESKKNKRGYKILEVGVGSGLTFDHLPKNLEYTGIDVNEKMLAIAKQKAVKHQDKKISLSIMDAHKMKFEENSYDLVLAPSVVTAMEHPEKGMKEMIRVTKKGGHIAVIANLRTKNSLKSEMVRLFDPLTRKFLGFRTDLSIEHFEQFKEIVLIEHKQVNNLFGFPLSSYLLFKKK